MVGFLIVTFNYTISVNTSKWNRNFVFFRKTYPQQTNVIKLIFSEGTPWKKEQQKTEKDLPIFPVSGSRIPKIPDFCAKRNENPQTRFAQTEWIFVSTQNPGI